MESDKTMFLSMMGLLSLQSNTLPNLLQQLYNLWKSHRDNSSQFSNIEIPEYEGSSLRSGNEIYRSVGIYLSSLDATANAPTVSIARPNRNSKPVFSLPSQHSVNDEFQGARLRWTHVVDTNTDETNKVASTRRLLISSGSKRSDGSEKKYVLKISNIDKTRVLSSYIDHISGFADDLQRRSEERKLFSNIESRGRWSSVPFKHPSTFNTLALRPSLKDKIQNDLDSFLQSREFYRRAGRAWKRGYLLYGPPGTGKSSLIAAIANYMNYDVYDLELTMVSDNSVLRQLLIGTSSKSVIVVEDIDCAVDLPAREMGRLNVDLGTAWEMGGMPPVSNSDEYKEIRRGSSSSSTITLSGLLNFADGLWSSCGEERIMIFTTNHRERLDPALLRSGRMDTHIHLSYCGFEAFKQLVFNYMGLEDHELFGAVEERMKSGGRITPADICEIFVQNKSDLGAAITAVVDALDARIRSRGENVTTLLKMKKSHCQRIDHSGRTEM